jgi:hypothetical protein
MYDLAAASSSKMREVTCMPKHEKRSTKQTSSIVHRTDISSTKASVPAAQYLRMSAEQQQYSIENQKTAIKKYADSSGFVVVKTYTDP